MVAPELEIRRLRRLLDACGRASKETGLRGTLRAVARATAEVLDADYAAIALWQNGSIREFIYTGVDSASAARIGHTPVGRGLFAEVRGRDEPLLVDDVREHPAFRGLPPHHPEIVRFAGSCLPALRGSHAGAIYAARGPGRPPFNKADGRTLRELALHAGDAVRNAESRDTLVLALRRTMVRHTIVRLSTSPGTFSQALAESLRALVVISSASAAELWLISDDGGRAELTAVAGRQKQAFFERTSFVPNEGLPGIAWARRATVIVEDITKDRRFLREKVREIGMHGFCALPLLVGDQAIGVLCCAFRRPGIPSPPEMDLIEEAGAELAQLVRTHRAEQELRNSEERHRSLVEHLPVVTYVEKFGEGEEIYTSPQWETMLGLQPIRTRDDWATHLHPDDREPVLADWQRSVLDGRRDLEYRLIGPDGRARWVRERAAILAVDDGRSRTFQGFVLDITAQKLAEMALRETTERLKSIVDAAPVAIVSLDDQGQVTSWNPAAERIFGWRADEVIGRPDPLTPPGARVVATDTPEIFDAILRRKDGTPIPVSTSHAALHDQSGSVMGRVTILADITDRKQAEEALERQAFYDALTGLRNRAGFTSLVRQRLAESAANGAELVMMLVDIDRFRDVNQTLGHENGDLLLQEVGRRLEQVVQGDGVVARLGADTFVMGIFQRRQSPEDLARRTLAAMVRPFPLGEIPVHVETSIGIALPPEHGSEPEVLITRCDVAMRAAKRTGNAYAIYAAELDPYRSERITLLNGLRQALHEGTLALHYQPIVALRAGLPLGVEALARWHHPHFGDVPPGTFVPLIEQTAMVGAFTASVLSMALHQLADWRHAGTEIALAVNVSARNLLNPNLPREVEVHLAEHDIPAHLLHLEITESTLIADFDRAVESVARLRKLGVGVALDDFGAGYSSFSLLQQIPVDRVKIDRSFVSGIASNYNGAAMARSLVDLAHNLGLTVVAEGVEDSATYGILSALGCDYVQGYFVSRALAPDDLLVWLTKRRGGRGPRRITRP